MEVDENGNPIETGDKVDPDAGDRTDKGDQTVPVSVVQSMREELNELKGQLQTAQDQVRLYQANVSQSQETQGQGQQQQDRGEGGLLSGREDDDVLTVEDAKRLISAMDSRLGQVVGELTTFAQKGDYQEVIEKHLPNVIKSNPALIEAIRTSKNPSILAYELGKTDPEYQKKLAEKAQGETQTQIDKNLQKPGSASQAGGGGGGLSSADQFAQMDDDKLEEHIANVKKRGE